ncbi:MAG: CPBP family intramembrane metalloprotease [Calditrichaeota bacterium]|nr:MAG: CPBP family intramembrane metalloprotease [Calditrichota bacterium]MBL1206440.1 CPBP family intramembrane metalloprotease [Calditrichota bacterium]NOG46267.1 CPBP family intramembrane metalloprotease [Calditrichota bacterium]
MNIKKTPLTAFILGSIIYVLSIMLTALFSLIFIENLATKYIWLDQFVLKSILVVLSVLAIIFIGKSTLSAYGFRKGENVKWLSVFFTGAGLGALATVLILATPAKGVPELKNYGIIQLILLVWFYSSITEEILTRGFVQGFLEPLKTQTISFAGKTISIPVFTGALLFSLLHLSLFFKGADIYTAVIIIFFTFLLGLLAGTNREKYKSIYPAIVTHIAFNIGGLFAGIIFNILKIIITGQHP